MPGLPESSRVRAAKACQRCSQRKIKCDASQICGPCSRCRMDGVDDCILIASRRGTYHRKRPRRESSPQAEAGLSTHGEDEAHQSIRPSSTAQDNSGTAGHESYSPDGIGLLTDFLKAHGQPQSEPDDGTDGARNVPPEYTQLAQPLNTNTRHTPRSLASMFEDFLEKQEHSSEGAAAKLGLILFGESSPLTFALEELNRGARAHLHDAGSDLSKSKRLVERPRGSHPPHCSSEDIAYLEAKGAFAHPDSGLLDELVAAFLDIFYPLYSIINKADLLHAHKARNLPWILLHAICFIGATFCDASVIYRSSYKSRLHARWSFYDKAKVLFDVGYEVDKVTLLQTVIMLTFWGPQMKSYWNPCSWIGFGATIAESLGIHRSASSAYATGKDKSLVKRLWWSLAVRDAYCATLLGRPFRINMAQCDTEMLDLDDFRLEAECNDQALYQIEVAKLSLIVRKIVGRLSTPSEHQVDVSDLHELLNSWQTQMPPAIRWTSTSVSNNNVFATSLKLLFYHHNILIHIGRPGDCTKSTNPEPYSNPMSAVMAESAAQMISSTAAMLVTKQITNQLPHEIFAGFFVAGIIFYRQQLQPESLVAQMARASLDNCQMLLNEVRDSWDPAYWVLRIFDFLLFSSTTTNGTTDGPQQQSYDDPNAGWGETTLDNAVEPNAFIARGRHQDSASMTHPVDWESLNQDLTGNFNDFVLIPNFFMPTFS